MLISGNKEIPRVKIGEKFYPPIFKGSEFRILDADKMLSPCQCHSFLRKTVPTASKQTGNKEQKGEVEKNVLPKVGMKVSSRSELRSVLCNIP